MKGEFFSMFSGTLAASILGNALAWKWAISAGEGVIWAGQNC